MDGSWGPQPSAGAKAVGIEIDSALVAASRINLAREQLSKKAMIVQGDFLKFSLLEATVITLFIDPAAMVIVGRKLLEAKRGTRIVSNGSRIPGWSIPDKSVSIGQVLCRDEVNYRGCSEGLLYLYLVK